MIATHDVPKALCFNFDETGVALGDIGAYTMAPQGAKQVRILGIGDKRQITVVTATAADGVTLPLCVIWAGQFGSKRAIPKASGVPKDWLLQQTPSHWMTGPACVIYLEKLIVPWVKKRRRDLGLSVSAKALMIMDTYSSHLIPKVREICERENILIRYVVPGFTGKFFLQANFFFLLTIHWKGDVQPQDVAVNQPFKADVKDFMQQHHEKEFEKHLASGGSAVEFEAQLQKSKIGPAAMRALVHAHEKLNLADKVHRTAFRDFQKCWEEDFQAKAKDAFAEGGLFKSTNKRTQEAESGVLDLLLRAADEAGREEEEDEAHSESAMDLEHDEPGEEGEDCEAEEVNDGPDAASGDAASESAGSSEEQESDGEFEALAPLLLPNSTRPRRTGTMSKQDAWRSTF